MEQYKDRADVQFITFNMDDNPGVVEPFMKEHKYSFVTIPAYTYVTETLKINAIPQNWIIDPQGVIRLKGMGYDSSEKWEKGMADAIDKVRSATGIAVAADASKR